MTNEPVIYEDIKVWENVARQNVARDAAKKGAKMMARKEWEASGKPVVLIQKDKICVETKEHGIAFLRLQKLNKMVEINLYKHITPDEYDNPPSGLCNCFRGLLAALHFQEEANLEQSVIRMEMLMSAFERRHKYILKEEKNAEKKAIKDAEKKAIRDEKKAKTRDANNAKRREAAAVKRAEKKA